MVYQRTDKNGTKYYLDFTCPKCGGSGYIHYYDHVAGGICFKCNGSGKRESPKTVKVYTEEYKKKLEESRNARRRKKAEEFNQKFFEKNGFNSDGDTYIVLGNTYKIKEDLKKIGCKYNEMFGWHSKTPLDEYPVEKINVFDSVTDDDTGNQCEICTKNEFGEIEWNIDYWWLIQVINDLRKDYIDNSKLKTGYFGEIGDKVDFTLKCVAYYGFDTQFGTTYIWKFVDSENHVFIWKTGKYIDNFESGVEMHIKGTIKDHNEYNGEQQTVLTRCRIA